VLSDDDPHQGISVRGRFGRKPASVVLADQVKSQDWRARRATRKGRVAPAELAEVRAKLVALIG